MPGRRSDLLHVKGTAVTICADDTCSTTVVPGPLSPLPASRAPSLFEVELRAQVDLTTSAHRRAVQSGDPDAAEDAAARLADLHDLLLRHAA